MIYPNRICQAYNCQNLITDAKRPNRMYCSDYCNKRTYDLRKRTFHLTSKRKSEILKSLKMEKK